MRLFASKFFENILLASGTIAPIIFILNDLISSSILKNYNAVSQSISELSAIGAPTRPYVVVANIVGYLFVIMFGVGIWKFAGQNWALRLMALFILLFAIINIVWVFFPMHTGQPPSTANVIIGASGVFALTFALFCGIFAFNGWFRALSIIIIVAYIIATFIGLWVAPKFATSPTIGIQERSMMYTFLVWMIMLSFKISEDTR